LVAGSRANMASLLLSGERETAAASRIGIPEIPANVTNCKKGVAIS